MAGFHRLLLLLLLLLRTACAVCAERGGCPGLTPGPSCTTTTSGRRWSGQATGDRESEGLS
ncbi:hypothetical protein ACWD7F_24115 [Streptomyces sp. NPDC005122]